MPPADGANLVRIVIGRSGRVAFRTELVVRFNYGAIVPWVNRLDDGAINAIAGPERLVLRTPVELYGEDLKTMGDFTIDADESVPFVLPYGLSFQNPPPAIDPFDALERTAAFWREWSDRCPDVGPWTDAVKRSLVTLKALTYAQTGGIVAAATTSLPERLGGVRNWDYRYCWLRDATFTLLALMHLGYYDEARAWRDWLVRARCRSRSCTERGAMAAGIDRVLAARLREFLACANRKRSIRATAARRLWGDRRRHIPGAQGGHGAIGARPSVAAPYSGISGDRLAAAR
jgi:GH15 family glucan-1,4-alpha-glucosidase